MKGGSNMSKMKDYLIQLKGEHMDCDCSHEYDLCELCERDLEAEHDYWLSTQTTEMQ